MTKTWKNEKTFSSQGKVRAFYQNTGKKNHSTRNFLIFLLGLSDGQFSKMSIVSKFCHFGGKVEACDCDYEISVDALLNISGYAFLLFLWSNFIS